MGEDVTAPQGSPLAMTNIGVQRPAPEGETVLGALESGAMRSEVRLQMRPHPCSALPCFIQSQGLPQSPP